jgi:hypothetical protein
MAPKPYQTGKLPGQQVLSGGASKTPSQTAHLTCSKPVDTCKLRLINLDPVLKHNPISYKTCNTTAQVTAILATKGITVQGVPVTATLLSLTLPIAKIILLEKPTKTDTDALQAIAVLLAQEDTNTVTAMIANCIKAAIDGIKETHIKGIASTAIGTLGETAWAMGTSMLDLQHKVLNIRQGVFELQACAETCTYQGQGGGAVLVNGPLRQGCCCCC